MSLLTLVDGTSAAIVLGGTVLGTVLRCGVWRSCSALRGVGTAFGRTFDADRAKSELAIQIQTIHRDGLLRAEPRHFGDPEFDEMADTIIGKRSITALLEKHKSYARMRTARSRNTAAVFHQAAELAPVFGLVGTLVALSQMQASAAPGTLLSNSIPMAIVTTFYGLIAAHLLFAPLARFIERRSDKEEGERQKLVDWLASELEREAIPHSATREKYAA